MMSEIDRSGADFSDESAPKGKDHKKVSIPELGKKAVTSRWTAGATAIIVFAGASFWGFHKIKEVQAEPKSVAQGRLINIVTQPSELHPLPDKTCLVEETCPKGKSYVIIPEVIYAQIDERVEDGQSETYRQRDISITRAAAEKLAPKQNKQVEITTEDLQSIAPNEFHEIK